MAAEEEGSWRESGEGGEGESGEGGEGESSEDEDEDDGERWAPDPMLLVELARKVASLDECIFHGPASMVLATRRRRHAVKLAPRQERDLATTPGEVVVFSHVPAHPNLQTLSRWVAFDAYRAYATVSVWAGEAPVPKSLDPEAFAAYACGGARALLHLAAHGIVHRDVKPDNLLATGDERGAVLIDFDCAALAKDAAVETPDDIGTPPYRAPEVELAGEWEHASDAYGLGVTLAFVATGLEPPDASRLALLRDGHPFASRLLALMEVDPGRRAPLTTLAHVE
jgi:hypothetical protein